MESNLPWRKKVVIVTDCDVKVTSWWAWRNRWYSELYFILQLCHIWILTSGSFSHGPSKAFLVPDCCRGTARNGNSISDDVTYDEGYYRNAPCTQNLDIYRFIVSIYMAGGAEYTDGLENGFSDPCLLQTDHNGTRRNSKHG